jgi:hypothetical protein
LQEEVPTAIVARMKELSSIVESATIEEDFKEFVENNKKEDEPPIQYVGFRGKYTEEAKPAANAASSQEPNFSAMTAEEKLALEQQKKPEEQPTEQKKSKSTLFPEDEDDNFRKAEDQ